jgi:hypothetical protein
LVEIDQGITTAIAHVPTGIVHGQLPENVVIEMVPGARHYLRGSGQVRTVSAVDVETVGRSQALESHVFASFGYAIFAVQTVRAVQMTIRRS